MSVYLYSREAADFLPAAGPGVPLYACIFSHEAYPSVCYGVLDRLARFLANTAAAGNPGNIAALRESGVFLVLTKNVDPDHMGYCLLYTSPSPRDKRQSRMPSSA